MPLGRPPWLPIGFCICLALGFWLAPVVGFFSNVSILARDVFRFRVAKFFGNYCSASSFCNKLHVFIIVSMHKDAAINVAESRFFHKSVMWINEGGQAYFFGIQFSFRIPWWGNSAGVCVVWKMKWVWWGSRSCPLPWLRQLLPWSHPQKVQWYQSPG